jgi:hypothetical protein
MQLARRQPLHAGARALPGRKARRLHYYLNRSNLSRRMLQQMIDHAYRNWCRAQDKPSSIPPQA